MIRRHCMTKSELEEATQQHDAAKPSATTRPLTLAERTYYKVINPKCNWCGESFEYMHTRPDGFIVLWCGRTWHKRPMAFRPDELQIMPKVP